MSCDCFVFVQETDEFRMWQGLVGPYYTPAVDSIGNLSWTNNGNLVNPPTVNVSGRGLTIVGIVDAAGDLPESAPNYTVYLVGTTSPYHAYIFDGTTWTDLGVIGKGDPGATGPGVPSGGSVGQVLKKKSATDYDTAWKNDDLGITGASVGDLVRISAVSNGKPTAFEKVPLNEIKCNPNLLDNWYFVGGGSQLGYGKFPINQRGLTTYSNTGFTVDRWAINAPATVTLLAGGAKIKHNSTNQVWLFWQYIDCASLVGKTITISRKIVDRQGSNIKTVFQFLDSGGSGFRFTTLPGSGTESFVTYTTTVPSNVARIRVGIFASAGVASGDYVTLEAIKLELGSTQTLAHQENGVWVLNEVPDYETELAKCKMYFERVSGRFIHLGSGFSGSATVSYIWGAIAPKAAQIEVAKITFSGTLYIWNPGAVGSTAPASTSLADGRCSINGNFFLACNTTTRLNVGVPVAAQIRDSATYIDFSCE